MSDPLPVPAAFHTRVRVRYEETDAAGVVYYANYLVYFEVARVEALRAVGMPITEVERRGVTFPAVSADCTYHSPGRVDDLLDVALWTEHIGRASFGFGYEVRRCDGEGSPGDLVATGHTRHAVVDRATLRPVRIEGWIAELVARAQEWRPATRPPTPEA